MSVADSVGSTWALAEFRAFGTGALELPEARYLGSGYKDVPQLERLFGSRDPSDHGTEECNSVTAVVVEGNDGRADIVAGEIQAYLHAGPYDIVVGLIIEGICVRRVEPSSCQSM